jgi:hypothetical protein
MTIEEILPSGQLLDRVLAVSDVSKDAYELSEILAVLGLKPTMKNFQILAVDLSKLAHRKPVWTKKYVHSVYKGKLAASPELSAAIAKLAQSTDGTPPGLAGAAYIRMLGDPAKIPQDTLIPASAVVLKCARPGCPIWFVRTHPRQLYHDPECRTKG